MEINITPETRQIWQNTLNQISGADRRLFMASVVKGMGRGGVAWAKRELGWDRTTIRKGIHELESGMVCFDNVGMRGRKGFAATLPQLWGDLREIGEASSQTDPTFRTTQLYRRLTAAEAKRQLLEKGYNEKDLPSERSLCRMLGELGFKPRRVAKSKPLRKVPQTDAIFEAVHRINAAADADPGTIRLSIDTKTTVPIGNLSRGVGHSVSSRASVGWSSADKTVQRCGSGIRSRNGGSVGMLTNRTTGLALRQMINSSPFSAAMTISEARVSASCMFAETIESEPT